MTGRPAATTPRAATGFPRLSDADAEALRAYSRDMREAYRALPTPAQERALLARIQAGGKDGDAAAWELAGHHWKYVVRLATRRDFLRRLPVMDLVQEGMAGAAHAARLYQPDKGTKFATYATYWIRQALGRACDMQSRTIRLPVYVEEDLRARQARDERPTDEQYRATGTASLDAPLATVRRGDWRVEGMSSTLLDVLSETLADPTDERAVAAMDAREVLARLIAVASHPPKRSGRGKPHGLTAKERRMLALRWGIGEGAEADGRTLLECGRLMGVGRERARQLEETGMRKLRDAARQLGLLGGRGASEASDVA